MKVKLAFAISGADRFFVLVENCVVGDGSTESHFGLVPYEDENVFLRLVLDAELEEQDTIKLVTSVILSVAKAPKNLDWFPLDLTEDQQAALGLDAFAGDVLGLLQPEPVSSLPGNMVDFSDTVADSYEFLMQAPTAFVLLSGPELRYVFANAAYSRQLSRPPLAELLGKPIREVLSDLKDHRFIELMHQAMKTGKPYVGKEVLGRRVHQETGETYENYFDFIYHPVRNAAGRISGLMVQVEDVTDRVLTRQVNEHREAQLYSQWAELEAIYQTAPVGMALFDSKDLRILRINDKHAKVLGSTTDQVRGKTALDVSSHLPDFGTLLMQAAKGKSFRNIILSEEPQGPARIRRSWLVNIAPALGGSGQIASISSVFLEIPGETWPGNGLEDSNNLIHEALESTTDNIVVLDREWNFIYLNSRAKASLPMYDTLLGRNHWEVFPASVHSNIWTEYHRTMDDRIPTYCTTFDLSSSRWYEINTYPAKLGMSIFFRDVTQRKLEEQALQESEERFRTMVDLASHIPFVMAPDGCLLDLGARFGEITGLRREDMTDRGFIHVAHPDDAGRILRSIDDSVKSGISMDIEWRVARKNGSYLWLRLRAALVKGEDGKVSRFYGSIEDIDELKTLKARLISAESALEELRTETGRLVLD